MSTPLPSHIPEALTQEISRVVGHVDYTVYVLDGQTAQAAGTEDSWYDALIIVDTVTGVRAIKFVQDPNGQIEHHELHTQVTVRD